MCSCLAVAATGGWLTFNQISLKQLANRASVRHFPKLPALVFAQFIALIEIHVATKA
jgi:hypothetical protein